MDKNIVFDFDETIGYFEQIIEMIKYTKKNSKEDVLYFLKIFPFVFRTNIFDIFYYIVRLKKEKKINSVILYSNNNNDVFIGYVLSFIHETLNYTLFDSTISLNQTHNKNKNITDLLNYSNGLLNKNSSIFFIDDKEYDDVKNSKNCKYYIKCESYKYVYTYSIIEYIFTMNNISYLTHEKIEKTQIKKNKISQSIYEIISKEIINKMRIFVLF
jgi:hypothetical protein